MRVIHLLLPKAMMLSITCSAIAHDEQYFEIEARINSMTDRTRTAIASGDAATAIDLYCEMRGLGHVMLIDMRLVAEINELFLRRYEDSFDLPANADSMGFFPWPDGLATFGGCWGVEDDAGADSTLFRLHLCPSSEREGSCHVVLEESGGMLQALAVDLDLDGHPEFQVKGDAVTVAEGLSRTIDRSPDARRTQWLISDPGVDPREKVRVWFYRDGGLYFVLVDSDGDGRGDCGRG